MGGNDEQQRKRIQSVLDDARLVASAPVLRPYVEAKELVLRSVSQRVQNIWQEYQDAAPMAKTMMRDRYEGLGRIEQMVEEKRLRIRRDNPAIDMELLRRGHVQRPVTPEGMKAMRSHRPQVGERVPVGSR